MKIIWNMNQISYLLVVCFFLGSSGCASYKEKGMFREAHSIFTSVQPSNIELYRTLLPDTFSMPKQPIIAIFIVEHSNVYPWPLTPYKESGVLLKCAYKGKEGWFVKYLPVTSWVAKMGGRQLGFPKYVPDEINLQETTNGWGGYVSDNNEVKIRLEYTKGLTVELSKTQKDSLLKSASFAAGNIFLLDPPNEGPTVQEITIVHSVEPLIKSELGMIKIFINSDEPWSALFPKDSYLPGVFNKFTGGLYIENIKRN